MYNVIFQTEKVLFYDDRVKFVMSASIACLSMYCLSRKASYTLFIHGFNRRRILLVFLNSEAVSRRGVLYNREIHFVLKLI